MCPRGDEHPQAGQDGDADEIDHGHEPASLVTVGERAGG